MLEDRAGCPLAGRAKLVRVGRPVAMRHLYDVEPESRRVGLDHLPDLRVRRLGEHDLRPPRGVLRNEACVRGDCRPVVAGGIGDVHARQLANSGLVLEDRLQHALAELGLVRRVGGQELPALEDGVDDRRHVVVVHPGAQE
jgi:hypothetical protein